MNIIKSIMTNNDCYKAGKTITVKGLMLHSVGCNQPKASVFINSWNKPASQQGGRQVCVHGFVEPNGDVYQTLPWNYRGWHGGSGSKGSVNNTHIGVEMTEPATITYTGGSSYTDKDPVKTKAHVMGTYNTAVALFAYLCTQYNLNPLADGVVISHKEGCARGVASNHGDPEHMWSKYGLTMNQFRQDVKVAMTTSTPTKPVQPPVVAFTPYKARVNIADLNIRKGPGTNHPSVGYTGKGVFTIVEEVAGPGATKWGLLKSYQAGRNGWVSLDHTTKV